MATIRISHEETNGASSDAFKQAIFKQAIEEAGTGEEIWAIIGPKGWEGLSISQRQTVMRYGGFDPFGIHGAAGTRLNKVLMCGFNQGLWRSAMANPRLRPHRGLMLWGFWCEAGRVKHWLDEGDRKNKDLENKEKNVEGEYIGRVEALLEVLSQPMGSQWLKTWASLLNGTTPLRGGLPSTEHEGLNVALVRSAVRDSGEHLEHVRPIVERLLDKANGIELWGEISSDYLLRANVQRVLPVWLLRNWKIWQTCDWCTQQWRRKVLADALAHSNEEGRRVVFGLIPMLEVSGESDAGEAIRF